MSSKPETYFVTDIGAKHFLTVDRMFYLIEAAHPSLHLDLVKFDTLEDAETFCAFLKHFDFHVKPFVSTLQQIIPTAEAIERVEAEYPDQPDAEKYRLAQAATLIDAQVHATIGSR